MRALASTTTPALHAEWCDVAALTAPRRAAMLALLERYFDGVHADVFERDLSEKDGAILLIDEHGSLRGFSTQQVFMTHFGGRTMPILFSGDTIVDRACWGQTQLMLGWGALALHFIARCGNVPGYWFLLAGGYRTYRFLPVFFHEFYPAPQPGDGTIMPALAAHLAHQRFGTRFDGRQVVRADASTYRLRPGVSEITAQRLRDPAVRLFSTLNPGHALGDELCCVAPLTLENFTPAGLRMLRAAGEIAPAPISPR